MATRFVAKRCDLGSLGVPGHSTPLGLISLSLTQRLSVESTHRGDASTLNCSHTQDRFPDTSKQQKDIPGKDAPGAQEASGRRPRALQGLPGIPSGLPGASFSDDFAGTRLTPPLDLLDSLALLNSLDSLGSLSYPDLGVGNCFPSGPRLYCVAQFVGDTGGTLRTSAR